MTTISILGIDIAKNTFQLHGADNSGSRRLPDKLFNFAQLCEQGLRATENLENGPI